MAFQVTNLNEGGRVENHRNNFAEMWASHLTSAIQSLTGDYVRASVTTKDLPGTRQDAILWRTAADEAPDAVFVVSSGSEVWKWLGARILAAKAGLENGEENLRRAYGDVLALSAEGIEKELAVISGRRLRLIEGAVTEEIPAGLIKTGVRLSHENQWEGTIQVAWSGAWSEVLDAASRGVDLMPHRGTHWRRAAEGSRTLDLLLEVELPVGVSFGRTQMKLRDAVKLTTGSIVELNRSVAEPVEVVINNCVIARGEVVVVEGNYGVKILEIVSREERLRTLF